MNKSKLIDIQLNTSDTKRMQDKSINVNGGIYKAANSDGINTVGQAITDAYYESVTIPQKIRDGSFNNSALNLGMSDVGLSSAEYSQDMITFNRQLIINFYHGSWVFRRVVDKPAQDMWRAGISISGETDPDGLKKVYKRLSRLRSELIWATQQARLFGGAASLMMVNDGETDLTKPLNINNIKPGSAVRLFTVDRWYGLSQSMERVSNINNKDFGLPKYYTFYLDFGSNGNPSSTITAHHSRVLRWVNRRSVRLLNQRLLGWGISELEHIYQDLQAYENSKGSAASLVGKSLLEVIKLSGLRGAMTGLAAGNIAAQSTLSGQLTAINNFRTNNLILLDSEDAYEQHPYSFSGLSDLLDEWRGIIAGAAEMPKVLLYGDTKGGMTSDSPAELEFYAGNILGKQDETIRPCLDKLLPVLYRCEGVDIPNDLDYEFESIAETSQDKKLNLINTTVQNVTTCMENGLMTHETALKELKQITKSTGFGTNLSEVDENLAKRMDEEEKDMPSESEQTPETEYADETVEDIADDYAEAVKEVQDNIVNKKRFRDIFKKHK